MRLLQMRWLFSWLFPYGVNRQREWARRKLRIILSAKKSRPAGAERDWGSEADVRAVEWDAASAAAQAGRLFIQQVGQFLIHGGGFLVGSLIIAADDRALWVDQYLGRQGVNAEFFADVFVIGEVLHPFVHIEPP